VKLIKGRGPVKYPLSLFNRSEDYPGNGIYIIRVITPAGAVDRKVAVF